MMSQFQMDPLLQSDMAKYSGKGIKISNYLKLFFVPFSNVIPEEKGKKLKPSFGLP